MVRVLLVSEHHGAEALVIAGQFQSFLERRIHSRSSIEVTRPARPQSECRGSQFQVCQSNGARRLGGAFRL